MDRNQLIQKCEASIRWLDHHIDDLSVPNKLRTRLAGGCLDQALEHQKAIVLLVANQLHGSAFAIMRMLLEAYVRGIWLNRCATDSELERISNGGGLKSFGKLVEAIDKLEGFEATLFTQIKEQSWTIMNGFIHTGLEQISRRNTEKRSNQTMTKTRY